jgi:hypothetical protein
MARKPPPHRRMRDPFRNAQRAPQIRQPGPSPLAAEMDIPEDPPGGVSVRSAPPGEGKKTYGPDAARTEWAVDHPGIGVLAYSTEDEARAAAGTAGRILHHGKEAP